MPFLRAASFTALHGICRRGHLARVRGPHPRRGGWIAARRPILQPAAVRVPGTRPQAYRGNGSRPESPME